MDVWLAREDIEAGIAHLAGFKRRDKIVVVDEVAARGVHHDGAARQLRKGAGVDDAARLRRRGRVDGEEFADAEQAVERGVVDRTLFLGGREPPPVVVMDFHVEGAGALGRRLADLAHAVNAEPLAVEPPADELHGLPAAPFLFAEQPLAFLRSPGRAKDQQHRDFRCRYRDRVWRVRDADAARLRGGKVNVFVADGVGGDDADAGGKLAMTSGVNFSVSVTSSASLPWRGPRVRPRP